MIFAPAIPYLTALATAFKVFVSSKKTIDIVKHSDDVIALVKTYQNDTQGVIQEDLNLDIQSFKDFVLSDLPEFTKEFSVTVAQPTTMPHYLQNQNDLAEAQIEKTNNVTEQLKFQNQIQAKTIEVQEKQNANLRLISETISSALPAIVLQMQEISKISSLTSVKTEIETAYAEQAITNHEALMEKLETLVVATKEQTLEQEKSAKYQTSIGRITDLQGNVIAEVTPQQMTTIKDVELTKAKIKEKEIADYQTTSTAIKNLDGNVVATAKPMEITAMKDAVNAKNETDEMEFELDDETLNHFYQPLTLQPFTKADVVKDDQEIYNNWRPENG